MARKEKYATVESVKSFYFGVTEVSTFLVVNVCTYVGVCGSGGRAVITISSTVGESP